MRCNTNLLIALLLSTSAFSCTSEGPADASPQAFDGGADSPSDIGVESGIDGGVSPGDAAVDDGVQFGDAAVDDASSMGGEGQACRADGSCEVGLECVQGLCYAPVDDAMELQLPGYHNVNTWKSASGHEGTIAALQNNASWHRYDINPTGGLATCDTITLARGNSYAGAVQKFLLFIPDGLDFLDWRVAICPTCGGGGGGIAMTARFVPVSEHGEIVFDDAVTRWSDPRTTLQYFLSKDKGLTEPGWLLVWIAKSYMADCDFKYLMSISLGVSDKQAAIASARRWRTRFAPRTLVEKATEWHGLNDCDAKRTEVGSGTVTKDRDTFGNEDREYWP